ncbi:MAG: outer membrane beta-barrel protein [Spirochaetia bacterium]
MPNRLFILILLGSLTIGLPMTATALGLDIEADAGAGLALGTTNNPSITGEASMAAGGGVGIDLYLFKLGSVDLGICLGVDYSYLSFNSTWSTYLGQPTDQTSDANYTYINFPIMLVGSVPITSSVRLVVKAGGFAGYFAGGTASVTYSSQFGSFTNGSSNLNSSNTYTWEGGLNFTVGVDLPVGTNVSFSPALRFNMGLSNTTVPFAGTSFNDTFWALTALIGIKYKAI